MAIAAERKAAITAKLKDYKALVHGSRNAEDVMDVWPASAAILKPFIEQRQRLLPSNLSQDAAARITQDNAGKNVCKAAA